VSALFAGLEVPTIASGFVSPSWKTPERLEAREPWRLSCLDAAEKCLERKVKPLERDLLGLGVQ